MNDSTCVEDERRSDVESRMVFASVAAMVAAYVVGQALTLMGIRWDRGSLGVVLIVLATVPVARAVRARGSWSWRTSRSFGWGLGDAVAILAIAGFTWRALRGQAFFADWFYGWGVKAHKSFLVGGIPWEALAAPHTNGLSHPAYPNLWPTIAGMASIAAGRFEELALVALSAVWILLIVLALRGAARQVGVDHWTLQATVAGSAIALAGIGGRLALAGAADWFLALAVAMALPALFRVTPAQGADDCKTRRDDCLIAFAAALAASSKIEGVPLAGVIVVAYLGAHWRERRGSSWRRWLRLALPAAAAVLPWAIELRRHAIPWPPSGAIEFELLPVVLAQVGRRLVYGAWRGLGLAVLLAIVALVVGRAGRWAGLIGVGHLAAVIYAYVAVPFGAELWVRLSFERILLHVFPLLPALFIALHLRHGLGGETSETVA